jgi:hypothetical protein
MFTQVNKASWVIDKFPYSLKRILWRMKEIQIPIVDISSRNHTRDDFTDGSKILKVPLHPSQ